MQLGRRLAAFVVGCCFHFPATFAQSPSQDPVLQRVDGIRDRFVAAVRQCGVTPSFVPSVAVDNLANGVSYEHRIVHVSRWSKLDPAVQGAMKAWASQGTLGLDAEGQWGEVFNDLLVAHELGHYLEAMSHRLQMQDNAQNEIDANEIALAFWSIDEADKRRLPSRIANYTTFLYALPSPVPSGVESGQYFQSHYEQLQNDLSAYGWYQGQFMRTAWASYGTRTFCDWVVANRPLPVDPPK